MVGNKRSNENSQLRKEDYDALESSSLSSRGRGRRGDDDNNDNVITNSFVRADAETLAKRRIIRRTQQEQEEQEQQEQRGGGGGIGLGLGLLPPTGSSSSGTSSSQTTNPFGSINLLPSLSTSTKAVGFSTAVSSASSSSSAWPTTSFWSTSTLTKNTATETATANSTNDDNGKNDNAAMNKKHQLTTSLMKPPSTSMGLVPPNPSSWNTTNTMTTTTTTTKNNLSSNKFSFQPSSSSTAAVTNATNQHGPIWKEARKMENNFQSTMLHYLTSTSNNKNNDTDDTDDDDDDDDVLDLSVLIVQYQLYESYLISKWDADRIQQKNQRSNNETNVPKVTTTINKPKPPPPPQQQQQPKPNTTTTNILTMPTSISGFSSFGTQPSTTTASKTSSSIFKFGQSNNTSSASSITPTNNNNNNNDNNDNDDDDGIPTEPTVAAESGGNDPNWETIGSYERVRFYRLTDPKQPAASSWVSFAFGKLDIQKSSNNTSQSSNNTSQQQQQKLTNNNNSYRMIMRDHVTGKVQINMTVSSSKSTTTTQYKLSEDVKKNTGQIGFSGINDIDRGYEGFTMKAVLSTIQPLHNQLTSL